jgi:hypothetical protein
MRQKSGPEKQPAEDAIRDIRRATRRHFSAEEKIRSYWKGYAGRRAYVYTSGHGFGWLFQGACAGRLRRPWRLRQCRQGRSSHEILTTRDKGDRVRRLSPVVGSHLGLRISNFTPKKP